MDKFAIHERKLNKFLNDYLEKILKEEEKKKEMFSNTNYLKWLENFTLEHPNFADTDWLYFKDELIKDDMENVTKLHLLYEGIECYASENYIYPLERKFGNYYNIKLDNICYEIGILSGQGVSFFCIRKELDDNLKYIDFNDIIINRKQNNVDEISLQLKELSNKVLELYKNGISLDAIIESLNETFKEIAKDDKTSIKTLKKF